METAFNKPRLRSLLDHFAILEDPRESWRVAHPLSEVLLLVVCGSICSCDDFDDIAAWGEAHLGFLKRFLPFHHGVPGARWLNILMNRIDPGLFSDCFMAWVRETWPEAPSLIALDGKTSRRSHDRAAGRAPLHLVSAFATAECLVLGQEATDENSNEITAIPALLERLAKTGALAGATVTIDAIACNPKIAGEIVAHGADYVLAVKDNQSGLKAEIESFFTYAPSTALDSHRDIDKGHGRIEERLCTVSRQVDWLAGPRHFPGEYRFPNLAALIRLESKTELKDRCHKEVHYYIASKYLPAERFAGVVRNHWRIENSLHWVLDVVFNDDLARVRKGHGAKNMAVVRHFALNLVRQATDKLSLKTRRKKASWNPDYLASLIQQTCR
jgi:predicted transposase YbfD/YdcC